MVKTLSHKQALFNEDYADLIGGPLPADAMRGGYDGAATFDRQITSWNPPIRSADADILPNKDILDARARDIWRNDAYVAAGAMQHKDSIVGSMFVLNAKPNGEILGWDDGRIEAFQTEVEAKFQTWAESPHKWVDASRQNDLTELVRLAVGVYVFAGEMLATAEWIDRKRREYKTAIQMIDTDRLRTPYEKEDDPLVRAGIRHDSYGAPVSAYIRVRHPSDYRNMLMTDALAYKQVGFWKPWGRPQVIHIREQQRVDQTRGVSEIVAGLKGLAITQKFRDVTLQNAVINATYAATIESELPTEILYNQLGSGNIGDQIGNYASTYLGLINEYASNANHMRIDGAKIPHLFPGTKFNLMPAGNPGGVGQDFETSLLRYVAASLNLSYEELSRDFSKVNYSSARAGMLQTWRGMQSRKKIVADHLANMIYRLWLEEAINNDRLDSVRASEAGMFYNEDGHQNMMWDALTRADWIGASRGQIDELKETQASVLRIKFGLSTHEDELSKQGKDWRKVFAQLERETKMREEMGIVLEESNAVNAASGSPREAENDGTETKDAEAGK